MNNIENLVRQFGEQTRSKTEEIAGQIGVAIDREYLDKCFAVQWAMASIIAEEAGEIVEMNEEIARKAEGTSREEMGVAFCLNGCRGGFSQIEAGEYGSALEIFGLVRSVHGYLMKNDYRKMFAEFGRTGLSNRHAPGNRLKAWVIERYSAGSWRSARAFASDIEKEALQKASEFGANFSTYSMRDNIARWIGNYKKMASSP